MIKVEGMLCDWEDFLLGFSKAVGEDEDGYFSIFSIGFLFFQISILNYSTGH